MGEQVQATEVIVHGRIIMTREADRLSLGDALSAGHVVSRCPGCGHRESADTSWWAGSARDRASSLGPLRQRLRCACGSRSVALEVWPVTPHPRPEARRMYHWRA